MAQLKVGVNFKWSDLYWLMILLSIYLYWLSLLIVCSSVFCFFALNGGRKDGRTVTLDKVVFCYFPTKLNHDWLLALILNRLCFCKLCNWATILKVQKNQYTFKFFNFWNDNTVVLKMQIFHNIFSIIKSRLDFIGPV